MPIYGEMIHNLHPDHKIMLVYDERPYTCDGCREIGFGKRYSCDDPCDNPFPSCNFHLHKCCALPEPTLTHSFFPDYVFKFLPSDKETGEPCSRHCNACTKSIKGFVYHCSDKDWDLHPSCATLPHTMKIDYGGKKLELELKIKSSSKCDKCHKKEFIKNRKSWAYVSNDKDYHLHLHIGCVKDLLGEAWEDRFLKGDDGKKFDDIKGDDGKKFDDKIETKAMVKRATEQDLHPDHKIKLVYDERPYICDGCREYGFGSRYSCDDPFSSCNFHLHKCCALPEPILTHSFFPDYVFKFLKSDKETGEPCSRHCNACAKSIKGFVYHCSDKDWDLHPSCATLPHTMKIDYGGKKLELELKCKSSSKCDKCHKKEFIKNRKSWAYVSNDKDYHLHLHIGCMKDLLCEAWEDKFLKGDDGKKFNDKIETKAMVKRATEPDLRIVLDKEEKQRGGRFKKYKCILKFALSVIIAVIVGDPTGLVVGLISSILH